MRLHVVHGMSPALDNQSLLSRCAPLLTEIPTSEIFRSYLGRCTACTARREATAPVLPEGNLDSEIVVVCRNPGRVDDQQHRVLSPETPNGKMLDLLLGEMGLSRQDVYLTYSLFCHTRQDRIPWASEVESCSAWKVWEASHLQRARVYILMGFDACQQFFGRASFSLQQRFWDVYPVTLFGRSVYVFPCYHPGYVVRERDTLLTPVLSFCSEVQAFLQTIREHT